MITEGTEYEIFGLASCPIGTTTISQSPSSTVGGYCGLPYGCSESLSGIPFIYSYMTDFTSLKRIKTIEQNNSGDQGIYWLTCIYGSWNYCPKYSNYLYVGTSAPLGDYRSFTSHVDGIYFGSGTIGWKRSDYVAPNNYRVRLYVYFTSIDTAYADTLSGSKEIIFSYDTTVFTDYFNSLSVSAYSSGGTNLYAKGIVGFRFGNLYLLGSSGADGYRNDAGLFYTNTLIDNLTYDVVSISATKYSGEDITLKATPKDGIGPYYVVFRKNGVTIDPSRLGGQSNPIINAPENTQITRVYTLDDLDISSALLGTIDFSVYITDSCPTGSQTCTDTCTITIGCIAPVCNFQVT